MSSIISVITQLVQHVATVVPRWMTLFFTKVNGPDGDLVKVITPIGLFCLVLPLVGLGIGIIRRLVKVRA